MSSSIRPPHARGERSKRRWTIVTSKTTATWPALSELGVAFPKQLGAYGANIAALGPFDAIDDAAGDGTGNPLARESWSARSQTLSVRVQEPRGRKRPPANTR